MRDCIELIDILLVSNDGSEKPPNELYKLIDSAGKVQNAAHKAAVEAKKGNKSDARGGPRNNPAFDKNL